jgi:hypothetical protein
LKHGRKDGSSFGSGQGQPILDENGGYNFLPWLRIFLLKKGTMKVYKLKKKSRGIIANMNLGLLEVDLEITLPWPITVLQL